MTKPVFNPDDFVFHKVLTPEDNPTLLEYDAKNRLILVRMINPDKTHEYNVIHLSEIVNNNLLKYLPDKWTNENDRILVFAIRANGEYMLEKEKLKYNFETKETHWIQYQYKNLSLEDAKEIFESLKAVVFIQNTKNQNDQNSELLELARTEFYLDAMYLRKKATADSWLRQTDWRVIPDAPQTFEGEMELWKQWREYLRTCVKKPSDFDTDFDYLVYNSDFKWPINPETYHTRYPEHNVDYLSTDDQFSFSDVSITEERLDYMTEQMNLAVKKAKLEQEQGTSISRQMYKIIERYSLLDGIENVNLNPGEDQ
jgi:hypothetical protein